MIAAAMASSSRRLRSPPGLRGARAEVGADAHRRREEGRAADPCEAGQRTLAFAGIDQRLRAAESNEEDAHGEEPPARASRAARTARRGLSTNRSGVGRARHPGGRRQGQEPEGNAIIQSHAIGSDRISIAVTPSSQKAAPGRLVQAERQHPRAKDEVVGEEEGERHRAQDANGSGGQLTQAIVVMVARPTLSRLRQVSASSSRHPRPAPRRAGGTDGRVRQRVAD